MKLKLLVMEDPAKGNGIIQILEDRSPSQQPIIGFLAFSDREKKDFYINALTQGGKLGEEVH